MFVYVSQENINERINIIIGMELIYVTCSSVSACMASNTSIRKLWFHPHNNIFYECTFLPHYGIVLIRLWLDGVNTLRTKKTKINKSPNVKNNVFTCAHIHCHNNAHSACHTKCNSAHIMKDSLLHNHS